MAAETKDKRAHLAGSDDASIWMLPAMGGLELLKARYGRLVFASHAHEEYFVAVTETGRADLRYRGDRHPIAPGDVVVLNPEEVHGGGPLEEQVWGYRSMYPATGLIDDVAKQLGQSGPVRFRRDVIRDPASASWLRWAHLAVERNESRLQQQSLVLRALASLVTSHASADGLPDPRWLHPAIRVVRAYLDEHVADDVSLRQLADLADLSPYYVCSLFRREVGVPPHAYQVQLRVRRARELLARGVSTALTASETGFFDQAHLHRHFKRLVGVTPGTYRRAAARSRMARNSRSDPIHVHQSTHRDDRD